ncbi:MAG: hypothetical protein QXX51_08820 [Candidatus Bathyarchaeia archaeon]
MLYQGTFTNQRFITSATEPAVPYISSRVPFNLNVGVTPRRKLLEVMGREVSSHFTPLTTVALTKLTIANEKIRMKDAILYFTITTTLTLADSFRV